jgi:hypothetical protein
LKDRTGSFMSPAQGAVVLDKTLQSGPALATSINDGAAKLDKTLADRTEAFVATIGQAPARRQGAQDRTRSFASLVFRARGARQDAAERTSALATSIGDGAAKLDKTLADRTGQFNAMVDQRSALLTGRCKTASQFIAAINHGAVASTRRFRAVGELHHLAFQRVKRSRPRSVNKPQPSTRL